MACVPSQVKGLDAARSTTLLGHPKAEIRARGRGSAGREGNGKQGSLPGRFGQGEIRAPPARRCGRPAEWGMRGPTWSSAPWTRPSRKSAAEAVRLFHSPERPWRARTDPSPQVRFQAVLRSSEPDAIREGVPFLADPDPFLVSAAVHVLGQPGRAESLAGGTSTPLTHGYAFGVLLALRRTGDGKDEQPWTVSSKTADPEVRRTAIQWVGEERAQGVGVAAERGGIGSTDAPRCFGRCWRPTTCSAAASRTPTRRTRNCSPAVLQDCGPAGSLSACWHCKRCDPTIPPCRPATWPTSSRARIRPCAGEAVRSLALRGDQVRRSICRSWLQIREGGCDLAGRNPVGSLPGRVGGSAALAAVAAGATVPAARRPAVAAGNGPGGGHREGPARLVGPNQIARRTAPGTGRPAVARLATQQIGGGREAPAGAGGSGGAATEGQVAWRQFLDRTRRPGGGGEGLLPRPGAASSLLPSGGRARRPDRAGTLDHRPDTQSGAADRVDPDAEQGNRPHVRRPGASPPATGGTMSASSWTRDRTAPSRWPTPRAS